ncbi:unnamed protein product [Sphacelaria rigidula]
MATGSDAAQAAREATKIRMWRVVKGVGAGLIKIGSEIQVLAPLCTALQEARTVVEGELEELSYLCGIITVQVIDESNRISSSEINFAPLGDCVKELTKVANRYHDKGRWERLWRYRRDESDIRRLRRNIEDLVPAMGLANGVKMMKCCANIKDSLDEILVRLQPTPKLAPVPTDVPMSQSWHAERDEVVLRVCEILRERGRPAVAALTGRSGAGKTTVAVAMVGERVPIRPRAGETEDQARVRLDRVRALFPDGVVWLRVGKGGGSADRLTLLMRLLAKEIHENVMKKCADAPAADEDGESYVEKIVSQKSLRCLVVADDVWEAEVVEKLRKTGMWVLLTTRISTIVKPSERVVVDELTQAEAEGVLRGAAGLTRDRCLPDGAMRVLEICGHVAMDIAFVGRWSIVCTADNGEPKSSVAWADAVKLIETKIHDVRAKAQVENAGWMGDLDVNRLAVLQVGFDYLGRENPQAQKLYAALALFPDGYSFGRSDAAVLLDYEEDAKDAITILERWSVLRAGTSGRYRMHDAHVEFAKDKLRGWENVRKPTVDKWTSYISNLEIVLGFDVYALLNIWRALEKVGGEGWWASRPYDNQLVSMDTSDHSKIRAVHVVAELFQHDLKFRELEGIMQRVLQHCGDHEGDCREVKMTALYYTRNSLFWQGRFQEGDNVTRQLSELAEPGFQLQMPDDGADFLQMSTAFNIYGVCAAAAGNQEDAEHWFRKTLKAQEDGGLTESYQIGWAMFEIGACVRQAGRPEEAEKLFKGALKIQQAKLRADDPQIAVTLHSIGLCVREAGRPKKAERFFKRALEILQNKLGPDDRQVAVMLHSMGLCVREAGRPEDAAKLFKRALKIKQAKLGDDDLQVAVTLHPMGLCVREAGRPEQAINLFKRELEIQQAKLRADDPQIAVTLHSMGLCVREAGRPEDARELLKRALEIQTANSGSDDLQVSLMLHDLGICVLEAGCPWDAQTMFKQVLEIQKDTLGPDHPRVAETLHSMGRCAWEMGRSDDAKCLFKRAQEIQEVKLGPHDI